MKRTSLGHILLFALVLAPFLVSCGNDNESNDGGLAGAELIGKAIGTWMCIQSTDSQLGQSYQGLMVGKEVTINANGTYTSTAPSFGYTGNYSVNGNKITAKSNNGSTFVVTVSIIGDVMTWDGTASNGVTFKYVFQRESGNSSQVQGFTEEMVAGDCEWKLASFNVLRGGNSHLQYGRVIHFRTDGTCQGFHSMETAWRITNGRIETYYKETNEPIYVYTLLSVDGDQISVRMDGTLDDDFQATIVLNKVILESQEPQSQTTSDDFFNSKESLIQARNGCYSYLAQFETVQLKLEKLRMSQETVHSITPGTYQVSSTWQSAYATINIANIILAHASANQMNGISNEELNRIMAEIRSIRAFVYYNLAVLWGSVPLITKTADLGSSDYYTTQSGQADVLQYAAREIEEVESLLPAGEAGGSQEGKWQIGRDAVLMLKTEIELTLGNPSKGMNALNLIDKRGYENEMTSSGGNTVVPVIWTFLDSENNSYYPIYTYTHSKLYERECSGEREELDSEWANSGWTDYGHWAALKRLGKAQSVTGCYDYELLMPIPSSDLASNPYLKQNPGYF